MKANKLFQTVPNCSKLFQTVLLLSFLILNCCTSLMAQTKGSHFIPTFARKDNTAWSVPNDWDVQISGNFLQIYSFGSAMPGQYETVMVTSNLTQQTGAFYLSFLSGCGMNSAKRNDDPMQTNYNFKTYPNPVTDRLTIESSINDEIQSISIFDNLGRIVLSKTIDSKLTEINVANFNSGLYLIKIIGQSSNKTFSFLKK